MIVTQLTRTLIQSKIPKSCFTEGDEAMQASFEPSSCVM